jgi:hypothetical protein
MGLVMSLQHHRQCLVGFEDVGRRHEQASRYGALLAFFHLAFLLNLKLLLGHDNTSIN